jgi:hypothetical protein
MRSKREVLKLLRTFGKERPLPRNPDALPLSEVVEARPSDDPLFHKPTQFSLSGVPKKRSAKPEVEE